MRLAGRQAILAIDRRWCRRTIIGGAIRIGLSDRRGLGGSSGSQQYGEAEEACLNRGQHRMR